MRRCLDRAKLYVPILIIFGCVPIMAQNPELSRSGARATANNTNGLALSGEALGLPPANAEQLLAQFFTAEQAVREALNSYSFKRDVLLQTIGPDGAVTGEYIRNSVFVFDDQGNRVERVLYHPRSTLRGLKITKEDIQDLAGAQLLGLDVGEADKYQIALAGTENHEGRDAYVLAVVPKQTPDPHRMKDRAFVGRIWIDASSLQVLRVRGIVEPQGKQRFPIFDTWRQPFSQTPPFPSLTVADDVLHFPHVDIHYRVSVKYYEYKRFASTVRITEEGDLP